MKHFSFLYTKYIEFIVIDNSIINFDEHCHSSDFVITIVLSGSAILNKNGISFGIDKNGLFEIVPYEPHSLLSELPVTLVTMCLNKELVSTGDKDDFKRIVSAAIADFSKHIKGYGLSEDLYNSAINLFEKYSGLSRCKKDDKLLIHCRNQIESQPENENDLEYYAKLAFISKYHFIRKFKESAGLTPHKFLIQNRIRKAQKLLITGHSVADTALLAGFYDQSHLDKYFKQVVGLSPTEYLLSIRNFLQD